MRGNLEYFKSCAWLLILIVAPIVIAVICKIISLHISFKVSKYKNFNKKYKGIIKLINDKGAYGEYMVFNKLEKRYSEGLILANVYIPSKEDRTTEIDLIMVHKTGIYVFESKNYSGWIYGQEADKKWTIALNARTKNQVLNPIIQNKIHIKALMSLLELDENYFESVIVFSERCELKKVQTKTSVMKRNDLITNLDKIIENKDDLLNENQVNEIYSKLYHYCNASEEVKVKHINDIKQNINS